MDISIGRWLIMGEMNKVNKLLVELLKTANFYDKYMRVMIPVRKAAYSDYLQDVYYGRTIRPLVPFNETEVQMFGFDINLRNAFGNVRLYDDIVPHVYIGVCEAIIEQSIKKGDFVV